MCSLDPQELNHSTSNNTGGDHGAEIDKKASEQEASAAEEKDQPLHVASSDTSETTASTDNEEKNHTSNVRARKFRIRWEPVLPPIPEEDETEQDQSCHETEEEKVEKLRILRCKNHWWFRMNGFRKKGWINDDEFEEVIDRFKSDKQYDLYGPEVRHVAPLNNFPRLLIYPQDDDSYIGGSEGSESSIYSDEDDVSSTATLVDYDADYVLSTAPSVGDNYANYILSTATHVGDDANYSLITPRYVPDDADHCFPTAPKQKRNNKNKNKNRKLKKKAVPGVEQIEEQVPIPAEE